MHGKRLLQYALCVLVTICFTCLAVSQPLNSPPVLLAAPHNIVSSTPTSVPAITTQNKSLPIKPIAATTQTSDAQIWNLKNADIRAVIQTISILTGKNFIVDPRVHGNVTLVSQNPMTPDELYQVFLSMLQLLQYVAIPSGNVIKIVPSMDANSLSRQIATPNQPGKGDEIVVRVVPVNHVSATELVPVLRPLMSQSGSVTAYLPSNALILAGTASNINRLVDVIHQMDSTNSNQISVVHLHYASATKVAAVIRTLQSGNAAQGNVNNATLSPDADDNSILISANLANQLVMKHLIHELDRKGSGGDDTTVIQLNYLTAKKLAPILSKIAEGISSSSAATTGAKGSVASAAVGSSSDISIQAEDSDNAIIMHAPKAMLTALLKVVHKLDSRPKEVLVEAIIVNMDENLLDQLGIIWGTSNAGVAAAASGATGAVASAVSAPYSFAMNANHSFGFLPDGNLLALLQALKSNGSSDILSTPSVVVLDNNKASILDGQNVGLANTQFQSPAATATSSLGIVPFNSIERQDVALSLDVTPHVSPNHMIRLTLLQKDDTLASGITAASANPTINTTKIKTSVMVRSGNILVLGGLMSNEQVKTTQKLPILGDLPLIGRLFRYDTTTMDKKSLMVFIRPIIMSKHLAHLQTMNRYKYVRHQQLEMQSEHLRKQGLPLLPEVGKSSISLPQPVPTVAQLPMPTGTTH